MVRKSAKGKVLGKQKKLELVDSTKKAVTSHIARNDKRWKRVIAKMSPTRKQQFDALAKVTRRGVTRRFQRKKERKPDSITYECTIHLAKLLKGKTFHKRAPSAVKKIREFTHNLMRTKDNRIDASLNTHLWNRGVKGCPKRVRVRIERKVSDSSEHQGKRKKLFCVISHVADVKKFKGLLTNSVVVKK